MDFRMFPLVVLRDHWLIFLAIAKEDVPRSSWRLLWKRNFTCIDIRYYHYHCHCHCHCYCYYYYYYFIIIIHSKFFPVSDWSKAHAKFTLNQLLLSKFGQNFVSLNQWRQIAAAADYWTDDVKMTSKAQPVEPLTEKTWGQGCVIFGEQKNKERNVKTPLRTGKCFEWMIKQSLNLAFVPL